MKFEETKAFAIGEHENVIAHGENESLYTKFGKRAFDIVLALLLLPILAPVIAILWLVTIRDGGPGFYGHIRVGKDGQAFKCWKVRTMVADATQKLDAHLKSNPAARAEWLRDFKLNEDPRITSVGHFLRQSSLDELPQIWNVLKGEMSFVGPRPVVREELARYGHLKNIYLSMRPGITGLWQVSGRNDVSYDERVQMDREYSRTIGLITDCRLILMTGGSVVNRTGK